jgi:hypothetical protein
MAGQEKPFKTKTNDTPRSIVDDKLKPSGELHMLIGGPYTDPAGEEHRYGHTALRIVSKRSDLTYDFGRYGKISGTFGESGDGILRVWSSFQIYINGEIALHRKTTGFVYSIFEYQAERANSYFDALIANGKPIEGKSTPVKRVIKLNSDYHALGPNCTTLSVDGAKQAIPNIDQGAEKYNKPEDVLTLTERLALRAKGGSSRLFLPANLLNFLETANPVKPMRIDTYGSGK